jgi:cysteine desulfurase/selenocysteine lyase
MCGPTGLGILYGTKKMLELISPYKYGGGMNGEIATKSFSYSSELYEKFEGGTPNIAGIYGFNASIKFLLMIGINNIHNHIKKLKKYFVSKISVLKNIKIYPTNLDSSICIFNIVGVAPEDSANYLGNCKIIVRSGVSCAKLQHYISNEKQGFVRVSLYFYNDKKDIDQLFLALKKFSKKDILSNVIK